MAESVWTRFMGLMGRKELAENAGLVIYPNNGVHMFFMRFPIDVVYLDSDKTVVYLQENLKPWRMAPVRVKATSVIELPGSTLGSTQTAIGDEIEIGLGEAGQD